MGIQHETWGKTVVLHEISDQAVDQLSIQWRGEYSNMHSE